MGERFQFYIKTKNKDGQLHITAIHDQWCYGGLALKYSANLIHKLKHTDWNNFGDYDVDMYIQTILQLRWHKPKDDEEDKFYYHRASLEGMDYTPDKADTNHGCIIIDATDLEDIKASFYDEDGNYQPVKDMLSKFEEHAESFSETFGAESVFDRLTQADYKLLIEQMSAMKKKGEDL